MFRRVLASAPRSAGRILSTTARPGIISPARVAAPAAVNAKRNYHEKDKSLSRTKSIEVQVNESHGLHDVVIVIARTLDSTPAI